MQARLLLIWFFLYAVSGTAQDNNLVRSFEQKINTAKNDVEKIDALSQLADYYSLFNKDAKADSVLQKALFLAEITSDKELVLKILFNNSITNLRPWSSLETFERSRNFILKGLKYAQDLKKDDYVAIAYMRLAGMYRKRHLYDEAMQQATLAMTALSTREQDSLHCILYLELGDIYLASAEAVHAFKNYNTAFDLAYRQKNVFLQSDIYHRFSELYNGFGDVASAKKYLLQSLELNTKHDYKKGEFLDCINLARITNERDYIDKAWVLANQLNSERYKLSAKRLMYYWFMVEGKNSEKTFEYLNSNPDLIQFFKNTGPANFAHEMGNIYYYSGKYDSSLVYLTEAEKEIAKINNPGGELDICMTIGQAFLKNHDTANARTYYEKAFAISSQTGRLSDISAVASQLKVISARNNDFRQAYFYSNHADSVKEILESNAAKDKVVLLQVDQENKKRETDLEELANKKKRTYNLQIMAITVTLTGIFAFMLFLGMFAVSKTTIKLIGYLAFISLFEFIILVLDHPIVSITNGEPLKIWGIKILLILFLVPCQHFLESRLIRFLQSRKLLEARQRFSIKNWWARMKKTSPDHNAGIEKIEDDTAVL